MKWCIKLWIDDVLNAVLNDDKYSIKYVLKKY